MPKKSQKLHGLWIIFVQGVVCPNPATPLLAWTMIHQNCVHCENGREPGLMMQYALARTWVQTHTRVTKPSVWLIGHIDLLKQQNIEILKCMTDNQVHIHALEGIFKPVSYNSNGDFPYLVPGMFYWDWHMIDRFPLPWRLLMHAGN